MEVSKRAAGSPAGGVPPSKRSRATSLVVGEILPFPPEMPMVNAIEHKGGIYIRDCYRECYDYVQAHLNERRTVITVTGTPGTGTSMFGEYFFQRFRQEHPDVWIVLASFNDSSVFRQAMCVKGGEVSRFCGKAESKEAIAAMMNDAASTKLKLLHLYDGPPKSIPQYGQVVCFTSPNEAWLRMTEKSRWCNKTVFIPVWTLAELEAAAIALGLETIQGEIKQRFAWFGGVARRVLSLEGTEDAEARITATVACIASKSELLASLSVDPLGLVMCWDLVHVEPRGERNARMTPKLASSMVQTLLTEQVLRKVVPSRGRNQQWLGGSDGAASLDEWITRALEQGQSV